MELEPLPAIPDGAVALEWESHRLINEERTERGRGPLRWDTRLAEIARDHSRDMEENNFFSHDNPEGQDPEARGLIANYRCRKAQGAGLFSAGLGENILQGSFSQSTNPFIHARA